MSRILIGILLVTLVACATAASNSSRRVQTSADARPFQPSNMPVGDTVGMQATDDGKIGIIDKSPHPGTGTLPEDLAPPTHPKAATATPPDEDPSTSSE